MILTELTITDFGVFRGQHAFDLSPKNGRPIVLFGGKNGAGKSTILEAIRLCLYGPGALGPAVGRDQYHQLLASKIHTNPHALIQPSMASILVEFQYTHSEGQATYKVSRSWEKRNGTKISELFSIERNGKTLAEVDAEKWQDFIRELIPPGVSQLFFFDGEKIQQLAEDTTDQQALSDAIKSLLGVDIVERLQADLRLHFAKLVKPGTNPGQFSEIRELEGNIHQTKTRLAKVRQQRFDRETKIQDIRVHLEKSENDFAKCGGTFARNREQHIKQEAALKERIAQIEDALRQHCAGLLPFALVPDLCARLKTQLSLEERALQLKAGKAVLADAKREITERLTRAKFFSKIPGLSDKTKKQIKESLTHILQEPFRVEQIETLQCVHHLSENSLQLVRGWMEQANTDARERIQALSSDLEKTHRELHKLSDSIRKIPADEILKPILENIHAFNEKLVKASTEALLKDAVIADLELAFLAAERQHGQLAQKLAASAKQSGKIHLLPRVQNALEEYRVRLIEKKVGQLQGTVTECFNLLSRKKDTLRTIRIDPKTFSITLCDKQNQPLQKAHLSAGEKQIYAVAMLWALAKTSGRPLPIVIDTPLARLDSDHRKLLIDHYFPFASHQVIVLSTDTEVDEVYFDQLSPSVARAYHLDYDQAESSTFLKQGYFWKERDEAYKTAAN